MPQSKAIYYDFGRFRLDPERVRLLKDGERVFLTRKAVQTLLILVQKAGEIVTKDELYAELWGEDSVEDSNLTQYIYLLRKNLGEDYISTAVRSGYRFDSDVVRVFRSDAKSEAINDEGQGSGSQFNSESKRDDELLFESGLVRKLETPFQVEELPDGAAVSNPSRFSRLPFIRSWRLSGILTGVVTFVTLVCLQFVVISGEPANKSIAVLPFRFMGEERASPQMRMGMANAIINRLANLRVVSVRPTSSIYNVHEDETDPTSAGRRLGVDWILEGTIQRDGDNVRVSVQLIGVEDGETHWAEHFDQLCSNVFEVQDLVASRVIESLVAKLTHQPRHPETIAYVLRADTDKQTLKADKLSESR